MSTGLNWDQLMEIGIDIGAVKASHLREEVHWMDERVNELGRWRRRSDMNHPRITFDPESNPGAAFEVYIPPFLVNHFDGDALLSPFGTSTWASWEAAKAFHDSVLEDIEAGKYNETWKG